MVVVFNADLSSDAGEMRKNDANDKLMILAKAAGTTLGDIIHQKQTYWDHIIWMLKHHFPSSLTISTSMVPDGSKRSVILTKSCQNPRLQKLSLI